MKIEKEIYQTVETSRDDLTINQKYSKLFQQNYIIQSIIHVNIL